MKEMVYISQAIQQALPFRTGLLDKDFNIAHEGYFNTFFIFFTPYSELKTIRFLNIGGYK